jgi:hypothetical protein
MATNPLIGVREDTLWRLFDLSVESVRATGKAQGRYVNALLGFVGTIWTLHFMRPELTQPAPVQILGVPLKPEGLWVITPAALTVLCLGLIGSVNSMGPVWARLGRVSEALQRPVFFSDVDTNKNLLDFLVYVRLRPEGSVEPIDPPPQPLPRRWHISVFNYPLLLLAAIITTFFADYPGSSGTFQAYVGLCGVIQIAAGFRIWYRAVCRFIDVRREGTLV